MVVMRLGRGTEHRMFEIHSGRRSAVPKKGLALREHFGHPNWRSNTPCGLVGWQEGQALTQIEMSHASFVNGREIVSWGFKSSCLLFW